MALLQRIRAAQGQPTRRTFTDVDALRSFVATDRPDRSIRVNVRMRFYTATDEQNGCRLALLTNVDDEKEFQAISAGLHNLEADATVPFLFFVLVWGAKAEDYNFVEGDRINLNSVYSLQDWNGSRLGGTVRRGDVSHIRDAAKGDVAKNPTATAPVATGQVNATGSAIVQGSANATVNHTQATEKSHGALASTTGPASATQATENHDHGGAPAARSADAIAIRTQVSEDHGALASTTE